MSLITDVRQIPVMFGRMIAVRGSVPEGQRNVAGDAIPTALC
jgi:hypothetical protein